MGSVEWSVVRIGTGGGTLVERASRTVVSEGALVTSWAPVMLRSELDKYLWRDGEHVGLRQIWEDLAKYLYLPRVRDEGVLRNTVRDGASSEDFFGYAQAVSAAGRYEGLKFGEPDVVVYLDGQSVLVQPDVARRQIEEDEKAQPTYVGQGETGTGQVEAGGEGYGSGTGVAPRPDPEVSETEPHVLPRRFYGVVGMNPSRLGGDAGQIGQEVVRHLTSIASAEVEITLEIRADISEGVPDDVERTVSENCRTLKFVDFKFERE
jgi:hypothetical protein